MRAALPLLLSLAAEGLLLQEAPPRPRHEAEVRLAGRRRPRVLVISQLPSESWARSFASGERPGPTDFDIASVVLLPRFGFETELFVPRVPPDKTPAVEASLRSSNLSLVSWPRIGGKGDAGAVAARMRAGAYDLVFVHSWDACKTEFPDEQSKLVGELRAAAPRATKWVGLFEGISPNWCDGNVWHTRVVSTLDSVFLLSYLSILKFQTSFPHIKHVLKVPWGFVRTGTDPTNDQKTAALPAKDGICFIGTMRDRSKVKLLCRLVGALPGTSFTATAQSGFGRADQLDINCPQTTNLRMITSREKKRLGESGMEAIVQRCKVQLDFSWPGMWMDHPSTKGYSAAAHGSVIVMEEPNQNLAIAHNYGEVVPPGEKLDDWVAALTRALRRTPEDHAWIANAAGQRFTWSTIIGETAEFYRGLLDHEANPAQ